MAMWPHAMALSCLAALLVGGCSDSSKGLSSSDQKERLRAINELARTGDDRAADQVAQLVRHEDVRTASEALVALGRMPSSHACDTLKNVATTETRADLRKWAAVGLAQRREPEAAQVLRQVVSRDPVSDVRGEAARSLGDVGTVDDIDLLVAVAAAEKDPRAVENLLAGMEKLTGVRFAYDPKAPPQARQAALERILPAAIHLARMRKGQEPPDFVTTPGRR